MKTYPTLYKRTTTGAIQVWWMEQNGNGYRTHSGQLDGSIVVSAWTHAEPKNVGRTNATTAEEQATLEIEAKYTKKIEQGKYFNDKRAVDSLVKFFSPMLAHKFDPDRIEEHFYLQPKLNGCRCISDAKGLWSRNGKPFVNTPHIEEALQDFFASNPTARLDGELYNHKYNTKFQSLISSIKKAKPDAASIAKSAEVVEYHIYDFPSHPGNFGERWSALEDLFRTFHLEDSTVIHLCPTWRSSDVKTAQGLHERNKARGYEGSIVRLDKPYENKRTFSLMKYKDFQDAEFEIMDILEGKGNWAGYAKKVKCRLPTGVRNSKGEDFFEAGVKGDKVYAKNLLDEKYLHLGKLATIVFQELSEYGVPIFPIYHSTRDYE